MCENSCIKTKELRDKLKEIKEYINKAKLESLEVLDNTNSKMYVSSVLGYILDIIDDEEK